MSKEQKELTDLIDAVRELVSTLPDEHDAVVADEIIKTQKDLINNLTRAWVAYDKIVEDKKKPKSELDELINQWRTIRPDTDEDFLSVFQID